MSSFCLLKALLMKVFRHCREDSPVVLSMNAGNTKRKYLHTLEMIQPEVDGAWVCSLRSNLFQGWVPGKPQCMKFIDKKYSVFKLNTYVSFTSTDVCK
jgi:hypothetical protein